MIERWLTCVLTGISVAAAASNGAAAVAPTAAELQQSSQWVRQNLLGGTPPLSFTYNGNSSTTLLSKWAKKTSTVQLDAGRTRRNVVWTDPATGLQVRCESIEYSDHPVVEWTTYFRNTGTAHTPLLQNICGFDAKWARPEGCEFTLRGVQGDVRSADSYKPYEYTLGANISKRFSPNGGRPTDGAFPYFNLSMPGGGVILAIGWPGRWNTIFSRDANNELHVSAGQELTNMSLAPGEEVRAPMVAMYTWQGSDTVRAQNLWRRWMRKYNLPGPTGQPMRPMISVSTSSNYPEMQSTAAKEIAYARQHVKGGGKPDYWWLDAGWYPGDGSLWKTGTWTPDPVRYPKGVRELSDLVHADGMKLITWFEPERVIDGTWLAHNHPQWLLKSAAGYEYTRLLNLGNRDALNWLINCIDGLITSERIDLYRQDFNYDPIGFWRYTDPAGRQGVTENAYIQGYLAFWDELRRRHPSLEIDSCASGGRRNDLETLRRSVPLWKSDYQVAPYTPDATATGLQCQTYGLASWIPYFGTGAITTDEYIMRSHWAPALNMMIPQKELESAKGPDWSKYRRMQAEARMAGEYMLGDYYPLTPYSQAEDVWLAWQFDRSDLGGGMIQAFRRSQSRQEDMVFKLFGLDETAMYELMSVDTNHTVRMRGSDLMQNGFTCRIGTASGSAVFTYRVGSEPRRAH
jgi:alpha-galactosidase